MATSLPAVVPNIMDFLNKEGLIVTPTSKGIGGGVFGGSGGGGPGGMAKEEQERYLLSLLSFGLDRVAAEPERLAVESRANKKETEAHAVENYGAFLESAVCVRFVFIRTESIHLPLPGTQQRMHCIQKPL